MPARITDQRPRTHGAWRRGLISMDGAPEEAGIARSFRKPVTLEERHSECRTPEVQWRQVGGDRVPTGVLHSFSAPDHDRGHGSLYLVMHL